MHGDQFDLKNIAQLSHNSYTDAAMSWNGKKIRHDETLSAETAAPRTPHKKVFGPAKKHKTNNNSKCWGN